MRYSLEWRYYCGMDTPLKVAREDLKLSVTDLCAELGTHPQNYYRIERGEQIPKRDLARAIHEFFDGTVSLSEIYDPEYAAQISAS